MRGSRVRAHRVAQPEWSTTHVRYVRQRWSKGASATQIARELGGGISRHAVLGRMRRLGIIAAGADRRRRFTRKGVGTASSPAPADYRRAPKSPSQEWPFPAWIVDAKPHPDKPYVDDPDIDADIPSAQRRSFLDLDSDTCRWPVGDPASRDFFFCGAPPLAGKPYCAEHCARAYRARDAARAGASRDATAAQDAWMGEGQ
jgi:GcrA cell cycle regulator